MEQPLFPNFMQMTPRVPRRFWDALRVASVLAALALCISLFISSRVGLFIFWGLIIPLLPLLFFLAPGFWRNICPLAASNQAPRRFGFQRTRSLPPVVRAYGFLIPIALFLGLVPARKVLFNTNGVALGILLLATMAAARLACLNVLKLNRIALDSTHDAAGHNKHVEKLVALKHWAEPLRLIEGEHLTVHVMDAVNPAAAILEFARENHVSHILIGARQQSLKRSLLGSVSAEVAAGATCTVTIVRPLQAGTSTNATAPTAP